MRTDVITKYKRHLSGHRRRALLVLLLLAASLILRLILFRFQGYHLDEASFTAWFSTAAKGGLHSFYDTVWCDYPPFNIYIFWLFGKLSQAIGPDSLPFIIKLPQNLFDIATAFLIFSFLRQRFSFRVSLAVMALYAFNPAVIFDLAVWGQMDSIHTFFMIASLYSLFRSKYELSGGLFSIAILTKPQSVVLLPVIAYVILRNGGVKRAVSTSAVFLGLVYLVILPFNWDSPVAFLIDRYSGYGIYPFNSVNAYNLWALLSFWKPDNVPHLGLTYQVWGILAFFTFAAFVMWQLHRRYDQRAAIFAVALLMFGFFMLMTRMHERYLIPIFALLAFGWSARTSWRFTLMLYLGLTATVLANLAYVLSVLKADAFIPDGHWSIFVLVPANAILLVLSMRHFWRMQRPRPREADTGTISRPPPIPEEADEQPASGPKWGERGQRYGYAVAILAIIYFSVSVWNLGDVRFPASNWVPESTSQEIYLDIGTSTRVEKVFVLIQDTSKVDIDIYWGSPGSWTYQDNINNLQGVENPHQWIQANLGQETQYVRLVFKRVPVQIGEVALFSDDRRIDISRATDDEGREVAPALIDEQEMFSHPAGHKAGTYFDEVYFVQAAEDHLQLREPWERTHPPMSKLIIGAGIAIFGHNPFAWRIMGVVFATLMIPLIYVFARRLFNSPRAGLIAAFLLTFDFMHFVQARLATGESFILFFVMAMFYFFYRYWENPSKGGKFLFLSLVFFGFGFATKWVVMWGFVGMLLLLVLLKLRRPVSISRSEVIAFVVGGTAAVAIYLLSYIPYFLADHTLTDFWDSQFFMYSFHANLEATHPFQSDWWSWPIMLRPLWIYVGSFGGTTAYISSMGNPALWWMGIPAMLGVLWLAVRYRNRLASFILIPFLTQWLIFIVIGRALFIYHYYPNVLFVILAITLWAEWLWGRYRWGRWAVASYLVINVACFIFLFPVISGLPMTDGYWNSLRWLVGWVT